MALQSRPPLPRVFVLAEDGVKQAAQVGTFTLRGGHERILVQLRRGRGVVVDVRPQLVFATREEAAELREAALRLLRRAPEQHAGVRDAALHLLTAASQTAA